MNQGLSKADVDGDINKCPPLAKCGLNQPYHSTSAFGGLADKRAVYVSVKPFTLGTLVRP